MQPQPLSLETQRRLDALFAPDHRPAAERMLVDECGNNLPLLGKLDPIQLERFRFAAMKLSGGDLTKLREAIDLATTDWRDLLMAAGFGHDITEHERWWPSKPYSSKVQPLGESTLDYATPVAREPRSSTRAVGLASTLLAIGCGVISSFGFDDRITDSSGHDHAQLHIRPLVYPFLLACLIAAVIGIARVMIPLVRDHRVSAYKAFLLLLNIIAIVIPLAAMAHSYWASLLPLTFRSHGAPGVP